MAKNQLCFGKYKISERKRTGKNLRTIYYLTPFEEKQANIEDYSEKYLIGIRRGINVERYPECLPNSLSQEDKIAVIEYLKKRSEQIQLGQKDDQKEELENRAEPDFDIFEDILGI
jgi:hypothetical protein